ncbi:MAG: hypothetical protein ACYDBV_14970 [Nitrospiria bacterium]
MSLSEDTNRMLNRVGITAPNEIGRSEPNTKDTNYQILENDYATKTSTQGTQIGGGTPSTTGASHPARLENGIASSTAASGLGGGGRGFGIDKKSK